jgi:hypothetical protein
MIVIIPLNIRTSILFVGERTHTITPRGVGEVRNVDDLINSKGVSKMTRFKLLGVAAILSAAIATPVLAQQAVQEPGAQAFYQSLGVGSATGRTANALASVGSADLSVGTPARHHARASSRHRQ